MNQFYHEVLDRLTHFQKTSPVEVAFGYEANGTINVVQAPCACCTAVVTIDFPADQHFFVNLNRRMNEEVERCKANCICTTKPYVPDFATMGCDTPALAAPFRLECSLCYKPGPKDAFAARKEGWLEIAPLEIQAQHWEVTHGGYCPDCVGSHPPHKEDTYESHPGKNSANWPIFLPPPSVGHNFVKSCFMVLCVIFKRATLTLSGAR